MKLFTAAGFAVCVLILFSWPWSVGGIPEKGSSASDYREYQRRAGFVLAGVVVAFMSSAVGSALIVKRAKDEFRAESGENLRKLIEGATEDVRKKHEAADKQ